MKIGGSFLIMSWLVKYKQIMREKERRKAGEEVNMIFGGKTLETFSLKVNQNKDGHYCHVHVTF